ncbi:TPA_asm: hypothetical protein G1T00_21435 [Salmonella enterica subsp. enterica serovar Typhi str. CT18]|uniref:Uncharacterized protein n=6 Tax=Salmonella enterica I TaxID=59201 RepID=A0A725JWU1_SALEP|nr:hypothetical protein [Salmonella enterica]EAB5810216.1 hypothetical protein [Salmonella enterica subsp. enterica serovar Typhi]ECF4398896.1 hypothetical protein [Salmonella enterica subsp. enterica serovar Typhimurium]MBW8070068.1 hypothetical protein [Salmonella enterica subsp. enterica serovar Fulica]HAB6920286.1 hypothetical protein [Salmonella enterica subsp. enterica serovar Typhi str. CT18]HAB6956670.1 hypothetical protein [Salmonella enterica subsp. enterica serovar Typhi str. 404ty]
MPVVIAIERSMFMARIITEKRHINEITHTFYAMMQNPLQLMVIYITLFFIFFLKFIPHGPYRITR